MMSRLSRIAVLTLVLTLVLVALGAVLPGSAARAMTVERVDFVCPLCQKHFHKRMTTSGTSWGQRLDLMPIGNASFPWPQARCPRCSLVLFKRFEPAELERLRP